MSADVRPVEVRNLLWRRALRLWTEDAARRSVELDRLLRDRQFRRLGGDFVKRGSEKGRARALRDLRGLLGPVTACFEGARLGKNPVATWSTVRPLANGVINVEFVRVNYECTRTNLWSVRVRQGAAERFFERNDPGADFTAALIEANKTADRCRLLRQADGTDAALPGGSGAFLGEVLKEEGGYEYFLAADWYHHDMYISDRPGMVVLPSEIEPLPASRVYLDDQGAVRAAWGGGGDNAAGR